MLPPLAATHPATGSLADIFLVRLNDISFSDTVLKPAIILGRVLCLPNSFGHLDGFPSLNVLLFLWMMRFHNRWQTKVHKTWNQECKHIRQERIIFSLLQILRHFRSLETECPCHMHTLKQGTWNTNATKHGVRNSVGRSPPATLVLSLPPAACTPCSWIQAHGILTTGEAPVQAVHQVSIVHHMQVAQSIYCLASTCWHTHVRKCPLRKKEELSQYSCQIIQGSRWELRNHNSVKRRLWVSNTLLHFKLN